MTEPTRRIVVVIVVAIVLGAMICIPGYQHLFPSTDRWSWHMYTRVPREAQYLGVYPSGPRVLVPDEFAVTFSNMAELEPTLSNHLCETQPDLVAVEITSGAGGQGTYVRCTE